MAIDIKRLLERLWQEWEPVTMCGVLLPGGDQQLTLTIRAKETKVKDGSRVERWRAWRDMVRAATWYSAEGADFLLRGRPTYPLRTARLANELATRVWWSDGTVEDIDDIDLLKWPQTAQDARSGELGD